MCASVGDSTMYRGKHLPGRVAINSPPSGIQCRLSVQFVDARWCSEKRAGRGPDGVAAMALELAARDIPPLYCVEVKVALGMIGTEIHARHATARWEMVRRRITTVTGPFGRAAGLFVCQESLPRLLAG